MLGSGLVGSDEGAGAGPARRAARGGERPAGAGAAGSRRSSGPRRSRPVLLGETGRNILSPLLNTRKDASVSLLLVNVQWRINDVNELTTSAVKSLGEGGSVDLGADRGVQRHGSSSLGLACGVRPACSEDCSANLRQQQRKPQLTAHELREETLRAVWQETRWWGRHEGVYPDAGNRDRAELKGREIWKENVVDFTVLASTGPGFVPKAF